MIRFECDYTQGAVPEIIKKLSETNMEQTPGYSEDEYCQRAKERIKEAMNGKECDIHFLVGGTQTNMIVISSALRPYQGVLCADSGHINVHETGAIESTGHKVLPLESTDGKISSRQIDDYFNAHFNDETFEHMVQPAMVYISQPTENGTLYTKKELEEISEICRKHNAYFYIDGARLGYALAAQDDLSLEDLANLCDVFYIGGTKVGALFGEAVVIINESLKKDFRYMIKQKGAMLAKGRLLGIQFEELFTDNLYYRISKHAVSLAMEIKKAFEEKGIKFLYDSNTNQQFPILTEAQMKKLSEKYSFSYWTSLGNGTHAVRFCTSWATDKKGVSSLISDINSL